MSIKDYLNYPELNQLVNSIDKELKHPEKERSKEELDQLYRNVYRLLNYFDEIEDDES